MNRSRQWQSPDVDDAVAFTPKRHQRLLIQSRRIIDMATHMHFIRKRQERKQSECDSYIVDDKATETAPQPIVFDARTLAFIGVLEKSSSDIDTATKYQTDVVTLMNPKAGTTDMVFAFPIIPFDETSHDGMKMVFEKIMEALQFVENDGNGRFKSLPNAGKRKVHFCVDGLSSRNYAF